MNRFELALRTLFWIFFKRDFREKIASFFEYDDNAPPVEHKTREEERPTVLPLPQKVNRSEAVALLSLFQREGRLVDFLKEPIDAYSDAQIGAAARDVHRGCAAVLERAFGVAPLVNKDEGAQMRIASGFDPDRTRLTGNLAGNPPYNGILRHRGWKADKCELPKWRGKDEAANVVAPAEVEII